MLPINEKPFSTIKAEIRHRWMYFPFHDTSGTVVEDAAFDVSNGSNLGTIFVGSNGKPELQGTTTDIWDNVGYITPDGGTYLQNTEARLKEFFDFKSKSQMLIAFDFYFTALPAGDEYLLDYSSSDIVLGGLGVRLNSSGDFSLVYRGTSGVATVVGKNIAAAAGRRIPVLFFIDKLNMECRSFFDGIQFGPPVVVDNFPGFNQSYGFSLFAQQTSASARGKLVNSFSSGTKVSDLLLLKSDLDITGDLAEIAEDLKTYRYDLPRVLAK